MVVTTTSITAVSASMRSAQSTFTSPAMIQGKSATRLSCWPNPASTKANHDSSMEANRKTVVTSSAEREPAAGCGCGSPGETSRAADAAGGDGAPCAWLASTASGGPPG